MGLFEKGFTFKETNITKEWLLFDLFLYAGGYA